MQNQDTAGRESGTGDSFAYNEACDVANEQLVIDFDNVEDILDFSVHPSSEMVNIKKQRPKLHKKIIAAEPVMLLELKPKIDKFVNGEGVNPEQC